MATGDRVKLITPYRNCTHGTIYAVRSYPGKRGGKWIVSLDHAFSCVTGEFMDDELVPLVPAELEAAR